MTFAQVGYINKYTQIRKYRINPDDTMVCCRHSKELSGLTIGVFFTVVLAVLFVDASNGRVDLAVKNGKHAEPSLHIQKRSANNSASAPHHPDILSTQMDADVMEKLGNMGLGHHPVDRLRRDQKSDEEVIQHVMKAEQDSIIAADESSAARKHSLDAASEAAAAEDGIGNEIYTFEENNDGKLVHVSNMESLNENSYGEEKEHEISSQYGIPGRASVFETFPKQSYPQTGQVNKHYGLNHIEKNDLESNFVGNDHHNSNKVDVETPLNKLIEQSSDLAKETRLVFQVIAKREDYLVTEMESFKKALQDAIKIIQETAKENKLRFKRWDNVKLDSYKACVYVTPPELRQGQQTLEDKNVYIPPERFIQEKQYIPPTPPPYDELPPSVPEPEPLPITNTGALNQYAPSSSHGIGDDIDLSSIYWLKLPRDEENSSIQKVQRVLGEVRENGRDILIIPVRKGFTSVNDMASGFLHSVRVNPADLQSSSLNIKKLQRKFRLRIRRID